VLIRTKYFRSVFPKVTKASIEAYSKKYRFSEDEKKDVLAGRCCPPHVDALPQRTARVDASLERRCVAVQRTWMRRAA
jgi:hypothetical protein